MYEEPTPWWLTLLIALFVIGSLFAVYMGAMAFYKSYQDSEKVWTIGCMLWDGSTHGFVAEGRPTMKGEGTYTFTEMFSQAEMEITGQCVIREVGANPNE